MSTHTSIIANPPTSQFVYLLQERDTARLGENIYKIGRSTQPSDNRFLQYPKGSFIKFRLSVIDCVKAESAIKIVFKKYFIQKRDHGVEYFEGCYFKMTRLIFEIVIALKLVPDFILPTLHADIAALASLGYSHDEPDQIVTDLLIQLQLEGSRSDGNSINEDEEPCSAAKVIRTHQCDKCGKVFNDRSTLHRHVHNKKKPCVPKGNNIETFASLKVQIQESEKQKQESEKVNKRLAEEIVKLRNKN